MARMTLCRASRGTLEVLIEIKCISWPLIVLCCQKLVPIGLLLELEGGSMTIMLDLRSHINSGSLIALLLNS
jgi:hypothetical protein